MRAATVAVFDHAQLAVVVRDETPAVQRDELPNARTFLESPRLTQNPA
jgi:hypothetical protein